MQDSLLGDPVFQKKYKQSLVIPSQSDPLMVL